MHVGMCFNLADLYRVPGSAYPAALKCAEKHAQPEWSSCRYRTASRRTQIGWTTFEESLQVATSPCCRRDLPDVISVNPSLGAWASATAVSRSAYACSFLHVIGLPPYTIEVG